MDFVAISWTRPVPRVGFVNLASDPQEAAKESLTIRYQREVVRRYVKECGGQIIDELSMIELAPDRASKAAMEPLRKLVAKHGRNVTYAFVDFASVAGWRQHRPLLKALDGMDYHPLPPDEVMLDGVLFDPIAHFQNWEKKNSDYRQDARGLDLKVQAALSGVSGSYSKQASTLNAVGLRTTTGKLWTADNLRKFLKP